MDRFSALASFSENAASMPTAWKSFSEELVCSPFLRG
jgi:hypothetical protein